MVRGTIHDKLQVLCKKATNIRLPQLQSSYHKSGSFKILEPGGTNVICKQRGHSKPARSLIRAVEGIGSEYEAIQEEKEINESNQWLEVAELLKYCVLHGVRVPTALARVFTPKVLFHHLSDLNPGELALMLWILGRLKITLQEDARDVLADELFSRLQEMPPMALLSTSCAFTLLGEGFDPGLYKLIIKRAVRSLNHGKREHAMSKFSSRNLKDMYRGEHGDKLDGDNDLLLGTEGPVIKKPLFTIRATAGRGAVSLLAAVVNKARPSLVLLRHLLRLLTSRSGRLLTGLSPQDCGLALWALAKMQHYQDLCTRTPHCLRWKRGRSASLRVHKVIRLRSHILDPRQQLMEVKGTGRSPTPVQRRLHLGPPGSMLSARHASLPLCLTWPEWGMAVSMIAKVALQTIAMDPGPSSDDSARPSGPALMDLVGPSEPSSSCREEAVLGWTPGLKMQILCSIGRLTSTVNPAGTSWGWNIHQMSSHVLTPLYRLAHPLMCFLVVESGVLNPHRLTMMARALPGLHRLEGWYQSSLQHQDVTRVQGQNRTISVDPDLVVKKQRLLVWDLKKRVLKDSQIALADSFVIRPAAVNKQTPASIAGSASHLPSTLTTASDHHDGSSSAASDLHHPQIPDLTAPGLWPVAAILEGLHPMNVQDWEGAWDFLGSLSSEVSPVGGSNPIAQSIVSACAQRHLSSNLPDLRLRYTDLASIASSLSAVNAVADKDWCVAFCSAVQVALEAAPCMVVDEDLATPHGVRGRGLFRDTASSLKTAGSHAAAAFESLADSEYVFQGSDSSSNPDLHSHGALMRAGGRNPASVWEEQKSAADSHPTLSHSNNTKTRGAQTMMQRPSWSPAKSMSSQDGTLTSMTGAGGTSISHYQPKSKPHQLALTTLCPISTRPPCFVASDFKQFPHLASMQLTQKNQGQQLAVSAGHAVAFVYCCTGYLDKTSMLKLIWAIHSDSKGRADLSSKQVLQLIQGISAHPDLCIAEEVWSPVILPLFRAHTSYFSGPDLASALYQLAFVLKCQVGSKRWMRRRLIPACQSAIDRCQTAQQLMQMLLGLQCQGLSTQIGVGMLGKKFWNNVHKRVDDACLITASQADDVHELREFLMELQASAVNTI
ncbi:hypothetical protein CEUSTIGMA_g70.t1 [Chlamydomonas eustigma]|uniref:Uncharacterized protein n=1 Tax=Chlamydomonas eustigma TaxID=1157962 RepID=A0A250WP47_9CHLO|nr:hypothetical protein CEUSTIGMA_g70.t1 [Chlamydomonas eustigma]|eukprot:GAX72614.1 hypothetical protein CEUSTIGMA_g70.t1 [Chlamydomonas eustigma]